MTSEEVERCKKYLRSTLLSQKGGILATKVFHDYEEVVGEKIPYRTFGFKSLETFLSSIPDVCTICWGGPSGRDLMVVGVADNATEHIEKMVAKQQDSRGKTMKANSKRERRNRPVMAPTSVSKNSEGTASQRMRSCGSPKPEPGLPSVTLSQNVSKVSTVPSTADMDSIKCDKVLASNVKVPSCRPKVTKKTNSVALASPPAATSAAPAVLSHKNLGNNCVSVILKSRRIDTKPIRLNMIRKRLKEVEDLVSRCSIKFGHCSHFGVQVRLDYCFHEQGEAGQFFKEAINLDKSGNQPKLVTCVLMNEEELGYQHEPVLTEPELLCIQSSQFCKNLFRTSVIIKVVEEGGIVKYQFENVSEVNRFLFNKSGSPNTRSLGMLRLNVVPKKIAPRQGFYRLFTEEISIAEKFGERHHFKILPRIQHGKVCSLSGNWLLFSSKLLLFKFLVSDDASDLEHLQFDETRIVDDNVDLVECDLKQEVDDNCCNKGVCDVAVLWKRKCLSEAAEEVKGVGKEDIVDDNCLLLSKTINEREEDIKGKATEVASTELDLVMNKKDNKILKLKRELLLKEKQIEQEVMSKADIKLKLKEAMEKLENINKLSVSHP